MKTILSNLDVATLLLILTTIASCIVPHSFHIALISISILAYRLVDKHLDIVSKKQEKEEEVMVINNKIKDIDTKLGHLLSKDTVRDLASGINNLRKN